jgi:hypothetical protein
MKLKAELLNVSLILKGELFNIYLLNYAEFNELLFWILQAFT